VIEENVDGTEAIDSDEEMENKGED